MHFVILRFNKIYLNFYFLFVQPMCEVCNYKESSNLTCLSAIELFRRAQNKASCNQLRVIPGYSLCRKWDLKKKKKKNR